MPIKKIQGKSNLVGKNIKKYRELRGLSQRDLSNRLALLGITIYHTSISLIEKQQLLLKDFEIVAFCNALQITYDQIFENCENIFN